ncbi:MAG TPA: hypothetical protein VFA32_24645 [Dehalococcoidia bacterium]|jgi:hypothetical protein|nr:hypothetical protein [Dehalococcoidia bacterium]
MVNAHNSAQPHPLLDIVADHSPGLIEQTVSSRWRYQMPVPLPGHDDCARDGGPFYVYETPHFCRRFGFDSRVNSVPNLVVST